jgi:hypothetical protein
MQASPVMDAAGFIQGLEAVYREMWRSQKKAPPI